MPGPARRFLVPELWVLTALSALEHFWRLFTPNVVVFDELHYERFAGNYLAGNYLFDVHPPLGRMMFAAFARLLHIPAATLLEPLPAPALRILPAAFGTLLVPLVFVILRQLGASRRIATLGALAILLDNALLVASRFILPDIFLIVFGLAAVSAYLAARERTGRLRWIWLAASALLAGCALSVKWTGASALGVVLAAWFVDVLLRRTPIARIAREGALLVAIPVLVYVGAWAIHFSVLTHTGPGIGFMQLRFMQQLPGTPQYDPRAPHLSLWEKLREVHYAIRYGNGQLQNITHPASSPWYTWPIMKHPVSFWEGAKPADGSHTMIILLGNPVVWWGALIGSLLGLVAFATHRARFAGKEFGFLLLLGAALLNYVPFMAIKRVMYLYHYLFALIFLVMLAAFSAGVLSERTRGFKVAYASIVILMLAGFVYFLPLTYGWTLSSASWDAHFWVLHPTF